VLVHLVIRDNINALAYGKAPNRIKCLDYCHFDKNLVQLSFFLLEKKIIGISDYVIDINNNNILFFYHIAIYAFKTGLKTGTKTGTLTTAN
jgi:hypothetical protein